MTWMDALAALESLGYVLSVDGEKIRYAHEGSGNPTTAQITPLFEAIKAQKAQVMKHLKMQADFEERFNQVLEEINRQYEPGTIRHIRENYPGLWQEIVGAENRLSDSWLIGNTEGFKKDLNGWKNLNLQAIEIFQNRDAQEGLFKHGGHQTRAMNLGDK